MKVASEVWTGASEVQTNWDRSSKSGQFQTACASLCECNVFGVDKRAFYSNTTIYYLKAERLLAEQPTPATPAPTPAAGNVEMNLGPDLNSTALCSDVSVGQYCGVFLEKAYKCNIRDPDSNLSFFRSMDLF